MGDNTSPRVEIQKKSLRVVKIHLSVTDAIFVCGSVHNIFKEVIRGFDISITNLA